MPAGWSTLQICQSFEPGVFDFRGAQFLLKSPGSFF
jgi:hypothetical protein